MSQWARVGAETDPLRRARQLQRSWERLLAEGGLGLELSPEATAVLRPTIVESWRRSFAMDLDPTELVPPVEADPSEVRERWLEHPLGTLAHVLGRNSGTWPRSPKAWSSWPMRPGSSCTSLGPSG
jgi:hypothetical protein